MKAILAPQVGPPDVLQVADLPVPAPQAGEVLIRVQAVGVNPVDTYARSGMLPREIWPFTPGIDCAGIVDAVGEYVTAFQPGQRVYATWSLSGSYAQYSLHEQDDVHPLPDTLTFEQGACVPTPYATAWRSLFQKATAQAGQWVLVHGGSGGVGQAAIRLAKHAGLTVLATAGTDAGLQKVREAGADFAFNHHQEGYQAAVVETAGGVGVDLILEMLANENLQADLAMVKPHGKVVIIGSRGDITITPRLMMSRDLHVMGMRLNNCGVTEKIEMHQALFELFSAGFAPPVISHQFPLEQAVQAQTQVMSPGATGNIILCCP